MSYTYTYSIPQDFPPDASGEGKVIPSQLAYEIENSSGSFEITTQLVDIQTIGDEIRITFADQLSAAEKTALDGDQTDPAGGLIAQHNNQIVEPDSANFYKQKLAWQTKTGDTEFKLAARLVVRNIPYGKYVLCWNYSWRYDSVISNDYFKAQIQVDDSDTVFEHLEMTTNVNAVNPAGGFAGLILTPGDHFFDLDFGTGDASKTAGIGYVRMFLRPWVTEEEEE
jgi:hypothetical protein